MIYALEIINKIWTGDESGEWDRARDKDWNLKFLPDAGPDKTAWQPWLEKTWLVDHRSPTLIHIQLLFFYKTWKFFIFCDYILNEQKVMKLKEKAFHQIRQQNPHITG